MPEEQELKLTVTLDDQASATLQQLLQTMQQLGGSAGGQSSTAMSRFATGLQNANQHAGSLHSSLGSLAARGGFIGGVFFEIGRQVHQMAVEFAKAVLDVKAYADAMVNLDNAASRASQSAAQFQRTVAVMRESGISAEVAAKNIQGLSDAIADMQRDQSKVRENLLSGLRGAEFEDMANLIRRITTADKQTALNEIKKFGQDIRAYWTAQGQAERGARAEREFYQTLGVGDLDKLREEITTVSPELEKMYNQRMDNARRYQTAVEKTGDSWERSIRSIQATAFNVLPLAEGMEGIADTVEGITKMLELWERLIGNANEEQPPPGGGQEPDTGQPPSPFDDRFGTWPGGGRTWRIPTPGGGGAAPKPGSSWWDWFGLGTGENLPEEREGKLRDALTRKGQERLGGGAQRFFGATMDTGQSDASERYATIQGNTEQVTAVTEQLRRLNDFFELADMAGISPLKALYGGAGGGPSGGGPPSGGGGTDQSSPTSDTPTTATGPIPPGHDAPLPPVPWPEPSAGNVIPPGFGTGPGTAPEGIGGGGPAPWTGTVAPGGGGAYEAKPVAVPPGWGPGGSGQPWGSTPGGGPAQYPGGVAPGGGGPGGDAGQAAFLKQHRAAIMQELQDPQKRERFMGLVQAEVGSDPAAQKAFAEATIDRWAARGQTVDRGIASRYFGNNPRYRTPTDVTRSQLPGILDQVTQGSASFPGATGNASAGVARAHAAAGRVAGTAGRARESIIYENNAADRRFRENVERARSGQPAATPTTAAAQPQTTPVTTQGPGTPPTNASPQQWQPQGAVRLSDERGRTIDNGTMAQAEALGRQGDTAGLQRLFATRGYRMSGPACGIVATKYARDAGFAGPKDSAIATRWHQWGEQIPAAGINEPGRPFGSIIGTYYHGRYQGKQGRVLPPGETGGHVMHAVPGTYDPKTNTAVFVDQYGARRRNLNDIDVRYAGNAAVAAAAARRGKPSPVTPGTNAPGAPGTYPAVPFINLPGLGPKPISSDIITPAPAEARQDATRTDPGVALDARTLDSSPGHRVDVSGTGKVTIDVKNDPRYTTSKETLHKPTPIPRKAQMEPAKTGPSESADQPMEE